MADKPPLGDQTFKLTPYDSAARGQERVRSGAISMSLAIFLLLTIQDGDWLTLALALYFLIMSFQQILAGNAMKRLPEKSRALRVGPGGLYKMIEGSDVARLPIKRIKALWRSDGAEPKAGEALWLCTAQGVQRFSPDELKDPREWPSFVHHLERSLSVTLWEVSEELWRSVQGNSHRMKRYSERRSRVLRTLLSSLALSIPVGATLVTLSGVTLEQLVAGYPEASFMLLGGSSAWLNVGSEWGRVLVGPWMHFDLIQICLTGAVFYWLARPLSKVVGGQRLLLLVLCTHLLSGVVHQLSGLSFPLLGSIAPQVAVIGATWRLLRAQPAGLEQALGLSKMSILWLGLAHVLIFSALPPQALHTASIDLAVGVVSGSLISKLWSLETPLWRLKLRDSGLPKLGTLSLLLVTMIAFISYGRSLQREPERRLHELISAAPQSPNWSAQLAHMCSLGPCLSETRELLSSRVAREAEWAPLTSDSELPIQRAHLSRLRLSLAQDLSSGALSPSSASLTAELASILPSAGYADLLLSALAEQQLSAELILNPEQRQRRAPLSLAHLPHLELSEEAQRLTLAPLAHDLEGSETMTLSAQATRGAERLTLALSLSGGRLEQRSPSHKEALERAWLLLGEGEGSSLKPLALIALPLNAPSAQREAQLRFKRSSPSTGSAPALWLKLITQEAQPSAAQSDRLLHWRLQRAQQVAEQPEP